MFGNTPPACQQVGQEQSRHGSDEMDTTQAQVRGVQLRKPGRKDEKLYHVMPDP